MIKVEESGGKIGIGKDLINDIF